MGCWCSFPAPTLPPGSLSGPNARRQSSNLEAASNTGPGVLIPFGLQLPASSPAHSPLSLSSKPFVLFWFCFCFVLSVSGLLSEIATNFVAKAKLPLKAHCRTKSTERARGCALLQVGIPSGCRTGGRAVWPHASPPLHINLFTHASARAFFSLRRHHADGVSGTQDSKVKPFPATVELCWRAALEAVSRCWCLRGLKECRGRAAHTGMHHPKVRSHT